MNLTIIFLKYLGFFYVLYSVACLMNKKMSDTKKALLNDDGQLFLTGWMVMLFSLPIVLFHNIWDSYLTGFVSFFGWLGLLKAFIIWSFPDYVKSKADSRLNPQYLKIRAILSLIVGLICLYIAYIS